MLVNQAGYYVRFFNLILRGSTLASKFLLIFFLAGYLEPAELGLYGLFVATVAYSTYPLGFDFYTYNTREIIRNDKSLWGLFLKSQGVLHIILYVIFFPLYVFIFFLDLLPWHVFLWFYIILVLEHLNQELMRLLIAISMQLPASFALFFRQGIWCIVVVFWMYLDAEARNIETLLSAWTVGSGLALVISLFHIARLNASGWYLKIDWKWVWKGLKTAIPLFLATLSLSAVSTFDKYWFSYLQGAEALGAYVFYMSLAASLISFLEAGVFSFIYPSMIYAASKNDENLLISYMFKMRVQIFLFTIVFSCLAYFTLDYILFVIDKEVYFDYINIFYILVFYIFIQALSYVPHYALYAKNKDMVIVFSHIFSAIIFSFFVIILSYLDTLYAVPLALCLTYLIILISKSYMLNKYNKLI